MRVGTFLRAVAIAWPLVLAITLCAFARDREFGPAGAEGIGRSGGAYSDFGPARFPSQKVRGNNEFTRPERAKPAAREEGEGTAPRVRESAVIERESTDTGN